MIFYVIRFLKIGCNSAHTRTTYFWNPILLLAISLTRTSIGLSLCYVNITITILNVIHRPMFYLKQRFGDRIMAPSSGGTYSVCRDRISPSPVQRY
jgi:hypothetical protein